MTVSQLCGGPVSTRLGKRVPLILGCVGTSVTAVVMSVSHTYGASLLALSGLITAGFVLPAVCALAARLTPPESQVCVRACMCLCGWMRVSVVSGSVCL